MKCARCFPVVVSIVLVLSITAAWSAARRGGPAAEPAAPDAGAAAFGQEWFLVQLTEALGNPAPDGSFALRTGRAELDALINDTGIHRIEYALASTALEPLDPVAFRRRGLDRIYAFHVPHGADIVALIGRFGALVGVEYAEPDYVLEIHQVIPDDPGFPDQWNLHNTGQDGGTPDCDVDAPEAWEISVGGEVVIAVVDSGADSDHPDLATKLDTGRNFEYGQNPNDTEDTNGHGTRVSSVAAAATDNGLGIAGVCWNCRIMPIKAGPNSLARGFADALVWATDHGARVINVSQSIEDSSQTMLKGVGYAAAAGVVLTTSAGNDALPGIPYPAHYVETIAVGGTDHDDHWSSPMCGQAGYESRTGPELDVVAPAEYIPVADLGGGYRSDLCGTSYAAPTVAGLVGIMESVNPSIGREEARHLVRSGADDQVGDPAEDIAGFDAYHGWGRVNMHRTLQGTEAGTTLRVEGKTATRVYFETTSAIADSWDFARGDLTALREDWMGVDLGPLTCLEDDSPDADTLGYEDTETPAPGEGYFYVARFNASPGAGSYGGSSRNRDRMVFRQRTEAAWSAESDQDSAWMAPCSSAGDVNGDGYDDVIVGAPSYDHDFTNEGLARVYLGSPSGLASSPHWSATSGQESSRFGMVVASAGDVDGDDYDDVIVSDMYHDNGQTNEGRAFVYLGSASGPSPTADWTEESDQAYARFGSAVAGAGDVNGDGYDDVLVGAADFDAGQTNEGAAFLYYGSETGPSESPDWTAESDQAGANMGEWVFSAGDVNGDGYDDILIGVPGFDNGQTDEGRLHVYHGSPAGPGATPDVILEIDVAGAWFGSSFEGAGDVNGDGYDDVLVAAPYFSNGQNGEGAAFLYYGSATGLQTDHSWSFESDQTGAELWVASVRSNVNGDAYDDILVGSWGYDGLRSDEGKVWVFLGSPAGPSTEPVWTMTGGQAGAEFGVWGTSAGNVNGDAYDDVVIGGWGYDNPEFDEGIVYVYHGPLTETIPTDCSR
jgi:hypothetical protein